MSITQGLRRALALNRNGLATRDATQDRTWSQFADRVARLAAGLIANGLRAEDRVAILALNSDRYLETLCAVPWADAVLMPVNVRLAAIEIAYTLVDAQATFLIVDETFAPMLPALRTTGCLRQIVFCGKGDTPEGCLTHETLIADHAAVADADRRGDQLAGLFYTGGTTGRPKGVMLSQANLHANAIQALVHSRLDERCVYLHVAPMFHLADLSATFGTTLGGGTHAFAPRFDPKAVAEAIARWSVTATTFVPTMLGALLALPDFEQYDLSTLQCLSYGGSPMPEAILRRAMQALPHCTFVQGYGMTEMSPLATILEGRHHVLEGEHSRWLRSAGRPISSVELRVVDSEDRVLPNGEIGEIIVRGPNVMQGYWHQPEATALALRNGWMHTGDIGCIDGDGFVYIVDRLKDMIITGGENVYSAEVENAIYACTDVAMCAVIGIPHAQWGEQVHAVVVAKDGASIDATTILACCRERIAGYKCPRSIEIRSEALPISGAGKILKHELRKAYWTNAQSRIG